jgi:hypothetical protein
MRSKCVASPCPHSAARLVIALAAVALVTAACGSSAKKLTGAVTAPTPPATVAPAASTPALACHAQATRPHPRDHSSVGVRVTTVPHARVTGVATWSVTGQSVSGRANAQGTRVLRFRVGNATPGTQAMIDVHISSNGRKASCQASFEPRAALAAAVHPPPPAPSPHPAPPPTTAAPPPPPPPSPAPAGCHPLTDSGKCYEPGEFCRESDAGVIGLAGDGETIKCENNDGLRWEPI